MLTLMALGHPALALSQRERGQFPFSLLEKGGDGVGVVGWIKSRRDGSTINEIIQRLFFALRAMVDPLRLIAPYRLVLVHGKPLVSSDTAHGP